jgi:release factor glutamine methyltransferase
VTAPPAATRPTVGSLVQRATDQLRDAGIDCPWNEALLLAGHTLDLSTAALLTRLDQPAPPSTIARLTSLVARRAAHEPTAYLRGQREFYGRPFQVDPRVLIPRPETELLVDLALETLHVTPFLGPRASSPPRPGCTGRRSAERRPSLAGRTGGWTAQHRPAARAIENERGPFVVDVGTGSACIAATLALELPAARLFAVDPSPDALAVARANLHRHHLAHCVRLIQGHLLSWLRSPPDLVVANLPYIPAEAWHELPPDVRDYEPRLALDGGPGGATLLLQLIDQAATLGVPTLLAELDPRHAEVVRLAARAAFPGRPVEILPDLAGLDRVLHVGPPA